MESYNAALSTKRGQRTGFAGAVADAVLDELRQGFFDAADGAREEARDAGFRTERAPCVEDILQPLTGAGYSLDREAGGVRI